jgi:hypothetical protein
VAPCSEAASAEPPLPSIPLNIHGRRAARCLVSSLLLLVPTSAPAQSSCPPSANNALESGWRAYRRDSLVGAVQQFQRAQQLCPGNLDAVVGLGFAWLRSGKVKAADSLFTAVLKQSAMNSDAWEGRARTALRRGDTSAAVNAGRRALTLAPEHRELRTLLDHVAPDWDRAERLPHSRPENLQLVSRTRGQGFEVSLGSGWKPFYLRGVNLGVALPGRFPGEFPTDSARYAGWLDTLARMNANTIRVYTILPPSFYRALLAWNTGHPDRALWLVHGVWAELPPRNDFEEAKWKAEFQGEMRRVVDVVHGRAALAVRPGHAAGVYNADVSRWVLGYIVGREWEPFAVKSYDAKNRSGGYLGRYLQVRRAPAMDLWMAKQCDLMLAYEVDAYNALRPIAYTNWPTLDPLSHPTEASTSEEARWRHKSGRQSHAGKLEYENDAVSLDANLVEATAANPAGWFASYHAYPYYPDFMMLDPGYRKAQGPEGKSSYLAYLRQIVAHHEAIPTVISEYGVPSSRGIAHVHPEGMGHGGHDEREMAAIDARLTRDIQRSGAAGSILFAWMDEWFKKNWAVIDYEIPQENTRRWHNVMDAEQNYGILGQYAGAPGTTPRLGGDPGLWRALTLVQNGSPGGSGPRRLKAGADESFYYLAVEVPQGSFPWDSMGIQLALDTYLPAVGQHQLAQGRIRSEIGFEFLVDLVSPHKATMAVTPDYNRYDSLLDPKLGDDFGRFSRRPVVTRDRQDARFDSLFIITNRARFGRDGTFFPALGYNRGRLRFGTEASSTLSDWYLDEKAGLLELRLPWDLMNVTDPSSKTLLFDRQQSGKFGTASAAEFHVGVLMYRKAGAPSVVGSLPALEGGAWQKAQFGNWSWRGWTEPNHHSRLKPVYDSLKVLWEAPPVAAPTPRAQPALSN